MVIPSDCRTLILKSHSYLVDLEELFSFWTKIHILTFTTQSVYLLTVKVSKKKIPLLQQPLLHLFPPCLQTVVVFPPPKEAAGSGAAVWSLAAKNGIKSVARMDKELDSLPLLLSLWTRSCFPPRGVREGCGLAVIESGQVVRWG